MIAKKDLKHGHLYRGTCRNAEEAMWDAERNCFVYERHKFGDVYEDTCNHPEDDDGYDLFVPEEDLGGV